MRYQLCVYLICFVLPEFVTSQSRPTHMSLHQKYPNKDESEVCGRIRDVIPRNSGRFRKILIRNTNNLADYANDDCRRMTSRTKSKLDILASLVRSKWNGGVKVKVLLAWTDQIIPSDKTSLHYEGRSLRLQLSDGDRFKLGYLAAIALEAGFDWVHYVDVNYIRASVIPDVCQTSVDMVFLLDESGSVGRSNFGKVKNFVQKVIDFFNVGKTGTHIAVVTYSTNTRKQFNLNSYYTKLELRNAVSRIVFQGGYTYTAEALDIVRTDVFIEANGMRTDPGIPKVLVLLTDGKSNGKSVLGPANALRNQGINIFSIGVGNGVSKVELNLIASDPDKDYVFELTSFNDLSRWVDRLSSVSCSEGSLIKSCEKSVTTVTSGSFKYFRTEFNFVTGDRVSVEVRDKKGISHLYASSTSKNPGPLDPKSEKNENDRSPRAVSVKLNKVTKTVYVAVQGQEDINEFSLSFWDNLFSKSTFNVGIKEGLLKGQEISLELLSDQYSLQYSITDGNNEGFFKIDRNNPKIFTEKPLDREKTSEYNLVVVAQDNKNKCHKSRTLVVVKVVDVNDNPPKFTENPYQAAIKENAQIGTVVKTVKATDEDVGKNAKITYSISSGNPGNLFRINNLGQVILQGVLDYEKKNNYTIHLKAEDGGNPRKKGFSELQISVSDVNESPSIRCKNSCSLKVSEATKSGTVVGTVIGTDPEQCSIKYDINPSGAKNTFQISPNGEIRTKANLDREFTPQYVFFARVQDCGSPPLSASVKVMVTVIDVNDNDPKFNGVYNVGILENEAVGSKVVQVKADDADAGNNGEVRYSLSGHDPSLFKIDAVSGLITTKNTLDYEKKKLYKYTVNATDQGTSPRTATTTVTVDIMDVNDNKPSFTGSYSAKVKEDASIGTLVQTVSATDDDSGRNGEIIFSIISGNIGKAFMMESISGNIISKSLLDRETRSIYNLVIQSSDRGSPSLSSETTVVITIGDVNDNSPVFHGTPYRASVFEDLPIKQQILKVSATDEDSGEFGQISYSIKSPPTAKHTFQIDSSAGNIRLKNKLDYEKEKAYTFVIAATDGGGRESHTNLAVFVKDINDNAPVFNPSNYTASVPENVGVGHVLEVVKATDKDSGPRGRITYSITNGNVGSAFRCSPDGSVTVASLLDRETLESYTISIKASDNGIPSLFSTTEVAVTVTDVNDNKPTFSQLSYSFSVSENNLLDHEVGGIGPATDKDKDNNSKIVYFIRSGDPGKKFNVDSIGKLIAKVRLDREITSSYNLIVEARDKGSPALYTQVPVEVIVVDVNDNFPKFSKKIYNCQISENSAGNTPVCFIRASDKDDGRNGVVTYELVVPSADFSVDQKNGEIKSKVTFDREQNASYSFAVRAKDSGTPTLSSNATVNVEVIDKNDNEPVFKNSTYSFDVSEDAPVKTNIGQVVANDKDEGLNGQVVYSIIGGNTNTAFEINANTGDVQVKSLLDREKLAYYKLDVRANDRGRPSLFSSKVVSINVKDVNDNSPVFTKSLYNGIIAEDVSRDSAVVQVAANDPDEGKNSKITYSITGGQNRSHFSIEGDTGWIRTASILDYETKSSYLLDVAANDGGNPSRSNTSRVNITVTNTNDNIPTFVPGSSTVSVSEGVAIGTNVVKFNATDQDGSLLNFFISSGNTNNSLKIDSTGLLTTNKKLDREKLPRYNLTVKVKDEGNKSSSRNLSVIVLDVNDNAPKFEPSSYKKRVKENTPAGFVVTVTATDKDEGLNAKISFSIDRTSSNKFTINSATGVISSKTAFDYEQGVRHVIQVTAKDAGTPSLSSVATVEVNIIDINDNSPNFNNDYSTTLRENTAKGRTVLRVEATDPDSDEYGEIQYRITSGNSAGFFSLGVKDGVLKVVKPPDRETVPSFTLTIVASNKVPLNDPTTPTKTSCTVNITIEDVNDNAPIITNNVSLVNVQENSKSPTPAFDVKAVDKDIGANGEIQYEIVSGNVKNAFTIDLRDGVVSVNGFLLDRETLDFYTLMIRASDKGTPILFSEKDFSVNVTDEDDNLPVFLGLPYDAAVNENSSLSASVFQVKATDKDIGVNGKIAYSIFSGNNKGHFRIDKVSGRIFTNASLDYEAVQNYDVVVTAKDTKHTVQGNLSIRVVNINDNSPVFNPARYNVSISEDSKLYYHFLTLNATDKDPFGSLTYTIVSGNNATSFTLDSSNGQLRVASQLDRETTDFYNLTVRVTDGGKPALSDLGFVQVHITDSNDNAPKFNSSSEQTTVIENTNIGVTVLRVEATDSDLGVNAKLQYSIIKGNEENKFKLNRDAGDLRVNGNIDRETTSHFYLDIVARDQGSPSLTSENLRVEIVVVDENDNDPEFEKKIYYQNITENLSPGAYVEQVKATDKDLELNGKVVYSIKSGGHGHFTIGNETGTIETIVSLDRETISSYSVVIEASDLGSPHFRNSTVTLSVNVLDINDNAPRFLLPSLQGNATEEGPKQQFVTRISAVDSDEGRNAEIEYKLATQRGEQILKIDKQTGVIRTRVIFDYEDQKVHTFKVTAFDKGKPSLSTTANLTINVIDIDDNCPEFNPKEYNVTIRENIRSNYTIVRVTATDKDSGDNKGLDYGIRSGNEAGTLAIDPVSGDIRSSNSDVDREYSDVYSLVVRAGSDYCGVNASDTDVDETTEEKLSTSICKVNIFLTDVNDNAPKFLKPSYSHVFSNIYQTSLLWLNATDPDVGVNAEVGFASAGVERVDSQRTLTVKAMDRGQPPQTSNTTLVVTMAEGVNCEAMFFDVSLRGHVTVKTLCIFDKLERVGAPLVGEAIKLNCSAKGNTNPEYRWTRNSVPVTDWSNKGAFEIKSLTKDDAGSYFCIASSVAGTILSDPIELIVKESPTITVHPVDTWAGIGERAALHCLATGDQPMEYTWYKNNKILYSTEDLITNEADLVFEKVIPEDAEEYYCEVKNSVKNEPARSKKALLKVYSADSVVEMVVSVDKPRHKESCQYFNIKDLENVIEIVVEGKLEVTELLKPETTCNVTHCSSDPCKNQGKCLITESGFVCQCLRGWEGKFCEQDLDECNTESCGNGTCKNRLGSYSCDCKKGSNGKRCQLSNNVCKNRCFANQTCYPKETVRGYECINNVKTVSMVYKLDESRRPWKDWMKYDIEREIENAIVNRWQTVARQRSKGKRRRSIEAPDYSACSVIISKITPTGENEVQLKTVLVCSTAPSKTFVCQAMFDEGKVSSCTGDSGIVTETPPTQPPTMEPVRLTVLFFIRASDGEEMEATAAVSIIRESDIDTKLKPHGIKILDLRARKQTTAKSENSNKLSSGAIAGVAVTVVLVSLVLIVIAILILRSRKAKGNEFGIEGRSVLSRTTSSQPMLTQNVSMRELNNSEARGINNRTFSEIYEESEDNPKELEDGSFMFDNPQISMRKQDREYMDELHSSPWYHGSVSRSKAEELLDDGDNEGSFIVRAGLDEGEFYISVRAPDGGPKFHHMAVNRRGEKFVAVCGPRGDTVEFPTFHELVEYLRSTPTRSEGVDPDIQLKDYVEKK